MCDITESLPVAPNRRILSYAAILYTVCSLSANGAHTSGWSSLVTAFEVHPASTSTD